MMRKKFSNSHTEDGVRLPDPDGIVVKRYQRHKALDQAFTGTYVGAELEIL